MAKVWPTLSFSDGQTDRLTMVGTERFLCISFSSIGRHNKKPVYSNNSKALRYCFVHDINSIGNILNMFQIKYFKDINFKFTNQSANFTHYNSLE